LNGDAAVLTLVSGKILFATVLHLDGENVAGVYRIMNPDKLASIGPLAASSQLKGWRKAIIPWSAGPHRAPRNCSKLWPLARKTNEAANRPTHRLSAEQRLDYFSSFATKPSGPFI